MEVLNLVFSLLNQYCPVARLILIKTFLTTNFIQEIDFPYFLVENFIVISEQLNKDNFSILHLNIRSLNANVDNFREFLAFLNESFSVIVLTESWCD